MPEQCAAWHVARGRLVHTLLERTLVPLLSYAPRQGFEGEHARSCSQVWRSDIAPLLEQALALLPNAILPAVLLEGHFDKTVLNSLRQEMAATVRIAGKTVEQLHVSLKESATVAEGAVLEFEEVADSRARLRALEAVQELLQCLRFIPKFVVLQ